MAVFIVLAVGCLIAAATGMLARTDIGHAVLSIIGGTCLIGGMILCSYFSGLQKDLAREHGQRKSRDENPGEKITMAHNENSAAEK